MKNLCLYFSHEVGHWLNLAHTFNGGCGGGDGVADTPPDGGSAEQECDPSLRQTCSQLENYENFMDYSDCYKMFTQGQVDRMTAAINSTTGGRSYLWQESNLIATGCQPDQKLVEWEMTFKEAIPNNGSIGENITLSLRNGTFTQSSGSYTVGSDVNFTNVPTGLTPRVDVVNDTAILISLDGNATTHDVAASIENLGIQLSDGIFNGDASTISGKSGSVRVFFLDEYGECVSPSGVGASSSTTWKFFDTGVGNGSFGLWYFGTSDNRNTWGYPIMKLETYSKPMICHPGTANIKLLAAGETIDASSSAWEFPTATPGQLDLSSQAYTDWHGQTGYAGFRITYGAGQYLYGWFEIQVSADGLTADLIKYGYTQQPNGAIKAGECTADFVLGNGSDFASVLQNNLLIFPNPSTGTFNLSYTFENKDDYVIEIQNMLGETVYSKTILDYQGDYTNSIDLNNQAKGMYMISIKNGQENIVKKIVKQ